MVAGVGTLTGGGVVIGAGILTGGGVVTGAGSLTGGGVVTGMAGVIITDEAAALVWVVLGTGCVVVGFV